MNPVVRVIGKVLRMVGISSPEDTAPKSKAVCGPPSWRDQARLPKKQKNKQQQEQRQIPGFFPIRFAQGQNDNVKAKTAVPEF